MLTSGFFITAELRVLNPNKINEAEQALQTLCALTLQEPGCSLFQLHKVSGNPGRYLLWERFDDEAAFKRHFDEVHTRDYLALNLTEVVQYFQSDIVQA